ncbi:calpain-like cysteine protease [Acrasis kona]|uniref:Calpain-like cysteine protease n=1 Tax=Acrasis kona TaxID=1008807 RepID=A0AAW2ZGY7_9EUKA
MRIEDVESDVKRLSNDQKLEDLPVSKDILRLARKIKIMEKKTEQNNGEFEQPIVVASSDQLHTIYEPDSNYQQVGLTDPNEEMPSSEFLYALMTNLSERFQPVQLTKEDYNQNVNKNDHYSVTRYLLNNFGEHGAVVALLKSCHQTIIARVLHRLRDTLSQGNTDLRFKDVRGSWFIFIRFDTENLCTIHRRKEQIYTKHLATHEFETLYDFEWELQCNYDRSTNQVRSVQMNLLKVYPNKECTRPDLEEKINFVVQSFKNSANNIDHCFDPSKPFPVAVVVQTDLGTADANTGSGETQEMKRKFCFLF